MSLSSVSGDEDNPTLEYLITHVFFPVQLPNGDDHSIHNDHALVSAVTSAALRFGEYCGKEPQWDSIVKMLDSLRSTVQFKSLDHSHTTSQLSYMETGDVRAFLIRAQNAAIIFRKEKDVTLFESFEVSPKAEDVMASQGKLTCSYPGPAITIPNVVFNDIHFLSEMTNFLVHMNHDILDSAPTSEKAQSTVHETRDTTHPRYITELLTGILRSIGSPADISRISKRVGDDVVWKNSKLSWRRSSLWLAIKVVLHISLKRSTLDDHTYKSFMLFFMCCLAEDNCCADLSNHLILAMTSKISRRFRKLGSSVPKWLSHMASQTCTSLGAILEERWKRVQVAQQSRLFWAPSQLNPAGDIRLSLPNSGNHLRRSLAGRNKNAPSTHHSPKHHPRGTLDDFLTSDGAIFEEAYRADPYVTLYDAECAVEQGIDAWVDQIVNNDEACVKLEILGANYSSNALKAYGRNPELLSVMLLTTIELWIALDKIAIKETPILANYSPEVPTSLLEDLLLYKRGNLHRLRLAYEYLYRRHSASKSGWSVFSSKTTPDSFSVRFFKKSPHLQHLKAQIEKAAQKEVHRKIDELEEANGRYAEIERMAAGLLHRVENDQRGSERHAKGRCDKCRFEKELKKMQINVHEWPLPAEDLGAQATVFELDCPVSFNMWRSATFHLLVDLCTPFDSLKLKTPYIQLGNYDALRPYFVKHPRSRISFVSDAKPFAVTHYSKIAIPTTQEQVCVNNGLKFYGFDSLSSIPISTALGDEDIKRYCVYQLQSESYGNLQKYLDTTSHTSNEVMANQADCHMGLSVHEFIAFGHLRSGDLIQWLNILRELRARSLSFHRPDVHFLLAQTVSQVGPPVNGEWTWHQEIRQPSFCFALLGELEQLLRDVEANWLEGVTMDTISFILRRVLAASPTEALSERILKLLRTVRRKVFSWVRELSDKLAKTPGDEELRDFLRDAAAILRSTFDVDPATFVKLLQSEDNIGALLGSVILIRYHTPADISSLSTYSQLLLDRDRRLSLILESVISDVVQADSCDQGIDLAVGWVWPDYRSESKWAPLREPNSRWFRCKTAATDNQSSQVVHLNLLDGSLLVDGKPLGRLPIEIQRHPLYYAVFGKQVLEVTPADLPGMDYSTRGRICDHQVYFSLRKKNLVIQAIGIGSSEIIELVPPEKLVGDLPAVLIEGYAHWLNLSTSVMEIRPLDALWKSSPDNWKMDCQPGRHRVYKGPDSLVDIRSKSWGMVSGLLEPLDNSQNLIVTVSPIDSGDQSLQLRVALPRYCLSFFVNKDGDLQSHNIRGMVYDVNQSAGTLFGLVNQIVLRPKLRDDVLVDELEPRCILIPEGEISFRKVGHHVCVEIETGGSALRRLTYQTYRIDADLGCLTGNASVTSKLFCAYLHALTNGCGADPLTGRSGTEEALSLLRSANCWSIMKLEPRDAELLCLIASICPSRTWYPKHLKRMQTVDWLDLPVNSQHHDLYIVASAIKEHYERVLLFQEDQLDHFADFPSRDSHLLQRNAHRAAYLFPCDVHRQVPTLRLNDDQYRSRDILQLDGPTGEQQAHIAATIVYCRRANSTNEDLVLDLLDSWTGKVTQAGDASLSLRYDRSWLTPDLQSIWLGTYNLLRRSDESIWFQILFSLPAMAYASPKLINLVPVFVAFAMEPRFHSEEPPYDHFDLSEGYCPARATLVSHISNCAIPFEDSPESNEPSRIGEGTKGWRKRRLKMYNDRRDLDVNRTVQQLSDAWLRATPPQYSLDHKLYNVAKLTSDVQGLFSSCYRNIALKEHFKRVQRILDDVHSQLPPICTPTSRYSFHPSQCAPTRVPWSVSMCQLFTRPAPSLRARDRKPQTKINNPASIPTSSGPSALHQVIATVESKAETEFERRYISALCDSADFLGSDLSTGHQEQIALPTIWAFGAHYTQRRTKYLEYLQLLKQHLGPRNESEQALKHSGQWPRVTSYTLFQSLASAHSPIAIPDDWKKCLITLALLALELQRARRLVRLRFNDLREDLRRELENKGCEGWHAQAHPDWLLLQLQGNFLVRGVQAQVAKEMIAPRSGSNTAMQLNMGEGKSSVIIPIAVAALANGKQLVRVIVPKALTAQMFHLLVDRLGGLVNRRIYFLPFSRSHQVDDQKIAALQNVMSQCMRERGILVVQPEHILSLRLVSVEKQFLEENQMNALGTQSPDLKKEKKKKQKQKQARGQLSHLLLELQRWLHSHSRDILDESDEILHVRYQLVYTIGHQQHMEGSPERWTTTQQILGLVSKHAPALQEHFPLGVEYQLGRAGAFPHLRIISNAGKQLASWIIRDIVEGHLPSFNFGQFRPAIRDAIRTFISCEDVPPEKTRLVQEYAQNTPLWGGLLLLRGLLATGILCFAFSQRRWRVDYGLAPMRTMLAVPYRAKDVPAQRAEFGHPDVAIILTCLSYYYGGLSDEQLRRSFEILLKQDDPTLDYELWVRDCPDVPASLQTLSGVNIQSSEQWNVSLFPLFSRNRATINFYLSNVVFPKEAKEFPKKLSCSGWDLAEKKECLLTGFSGTNDGQYLLPLHITQRDPDHQRGTNARVLSYLLQPENNHYMCLSYENGERRNTHEFLDVLVAQNREIRVLLDVGAQMLDLQNHELAEAWLNVNPRAAAAIYFNEEDELTVRTREGSTQLLSSSPFAQQLDQCIVYLDDAHTRGTDITFPNGFRAAVTLGPKVTKDRLAQGCMRMRRLGHGHSIVFFAPLEVDRRIRAIAGKDDHPWHIIESADIIHWVIHETCEDIQHRATHWAQQGMDHTVRYRAWAGFCKDKLSPEALSHEWLQTEAKTLDDLYAPRNTSNSALLAHSDLHQRCVDLGVLSLRDVGMDEEQEREVVHEAERERQVERPPKVPPAAHSIHPDVLSFVQTGIVPTNSNAFHPAFDTLSVTSASTDEAHAWSSSVLTTTDFRTTVKTSSGKLDEYLRPVQWVVSAQRSGDRVLVILSPQEVNYLISRIRPNNRIHLHLYTARISRAMKSCNDLALYSVPAVSAERSPPSLLMDQLSIFAGQLYLDDYETYIRICRFLCLYTKDIQHQEGVEVGPDGFIPPRMRPILRCWTLTDTFQRSPMSFLRSLMSIRRKGMRYGPTHMGKLVDGRLLSESDFDSASHLDIVNPIES